MTVYEKMVNECEDVEKKLELYGKDQSLKIFYTNALSTMRERIENTPVEDLAKEC